MEMTTPPNPSGFSRKPRRKFKTNPRVRRSNGKQAGLSHDPITPEIAACIVAGTLMQGAMQILNAVFGDMPEQVKPQPAE